jgi:hypothetical protein
LREIRERQEERWREDDEDDDDDVVISGGRFWKCVCRKGVVELH